MPGILTKFKNVFLSKKTFPKDFSPKEIEIIKSVQPYTCTGPERIQALIQAVHHIEKWKIPGSIVECGVYKGGSMMAAAKTLLALESHHRDLYLFDTYEGMGDPSEKDITYDGTIAAEEKKNKPKWVYCSLEDVKEAFKPISYDSQRIHYVKGLVEETIPHHAPDQIALLRLDTDWYESTYHELKHLYPRLSSGGIMIIDDYGHWKGAKEAVDQYFKENQLPLFLHRIDYTARLVIKP